GGDWLKVWDVAARKAVFTGRDGDNVISQLAFSPLGTHLAAVTTSPGSRPDAGAPYLPVRGTGGKVWDARTGAEVLSWEDDAGALSWGAPVAPVPLPGSTPGGPRRAAGPALRADGGPAQLRGWDPPGRRGLYPPPGPPGTLAGGGFSPHGSRIAPAAARVAAP